MLFSEHLVVLRGGGDLGTGVAYRLHKAGFPVVVLELARPLAIRRAVAVASAITEAAVRVEGMIAQLSSSSDDALAAARQGTVAVLESDVIPSLTTAPAVVVDARLAKEPLDTTIDQAPLVIGLGPGFTAGLHCHAIVETMRGPHLGRVLWDGSAAPNTGVPGTLGGESSQRVVRARERGGVAWSVAIGDHVDAHDVLGHIGGEPVITPIGGTVRGLIADGHPVEPGLKIADVDPRDEPSAAFEISDKALAVGGGVLEAILTWLNR